MGNLPMGWGEDFSDIEYQHYWSLPADECQQLLEAEQTESPVKALLLYQQGQKRLSAKDYDQAIARFDRALELQPHWHEVWADRGRALLKQGNYTEAVASCDRALEQDTDDPKVWRDRGLALYGLRQFEAAVTSCECALALDPNDYDTCRTLSDALHQLGRYEEAVLHYDQVLTLQSNDPVAWGQRGTVLQKLGRYEEAVESYDHLLTAEPNNYRLWHQRGLALRRLGQWEGAIASFDHALDLRPDFYAATRSKLYLLLINGQIGHHLLRKPTQKRLWLDLQNLLEAFAKTKLPALIVIGLLILSSSRSQTMALTIAGVFLLITIASDLIAESRQ